MCSPVKKRVAYLTATCLLLFTALLISTTNVKSVRALTSTFSNLERDDALGKTPKSYTTTKIQVEESIVKSKILGKASIYATTNDVKEAFLAGFTTSIVGPSLAGLTEEEKLASQMVFEKGATQYLTGWMADMYEYRPASTQTYLADIFSSAKIIPEAQAQGLGFASLDPVMNTWKTFRNIAYFLFVIIFLVIGFMIMFRQKINGQTVITVQQAIPSIIIALIVVTFSYAIGGLLIDAMYISLYAIVGIFNGSGNLLNYNFLTLSVILTGSGFKNTNEAIQSIVSQTSLGDVVSTISGLTVGAFMAGVILYGVFKLFIELVKSYISIVLSIAFAPIILMIGAIPGQNPFGPWLRNLVGNLAAFPAILILLYIQNEISNYGITGGGFAPPFLVGSTLGVSGALPAIVGIGMLVTIPEIIIKIKEALGVKDGIVKELANAAWDRTKKWTQFSKKIAQGPIKAPAAILKAQPFSIANAGTMFKTTGQEGGVEQFLIGSRQQRARQFELRDQAESQGRTYEVREGGVVGRIWNPSKGKKETEQALSQGSEKKTV